ncbi:MAG: alkaline phosphatase family protein [candidate division FCPU426 bacterium]
MPHVLLIFIDGIGLGPDDPAINPFAAFGPCWGLDRSLTQSGIGAHAAAEVVATDATLGIPGLPQSATGQSALLTGVNTARLLGRHLSAYPNEKLKTCLSENGIFTWCRGQGLSATFANGYRREYWEMVERGKLRHSATTLSVLGAQGRLRGEEDFAAGEAVYHDITGHFLRLLGREVPLLTPQAAAQRLAGLAERHDFTLFEFFLTDLVGHRGHWDQARPLLERLDGLLTTLVERLDLRETALLIASDHGNFENLSVPAHTLNPVPTILYGPTARKIADSIHSLTDILPGIKRLLLEGH